jgi:hypothetical protein
MTKLIDAFRNFANAPKNQGIHWLPEVLLAYNELCSTDSFIYLFSWLYSSLNVQSVSLHSVKDT